MNVTDLLAQMEPLADALVVLVGVEVAVTLVSAVIRWIRSASDVL